MNLDWFDTTIGDQVNLQRGFDITKLEQRSGTVPVVSSGGVFSYHDTPKAKGPGVVIARKGNSIGCVHYVESDYWPHDTTLWVTDFRGNNPRFVYYFFVNVKPRMAALDVGSANPTLNRNHVHPIRILWPPVAQQAYIAEILGSLDDKIELNRRMSATLEAIARALFRSWFVDFDPVRAKIEGRQPPGMDAETAAHFPDSFEDTIFGPIPAGWSKTTLGDFCEQITDGAHQSPASVEEGMPMASVKDMNNWGIDLSSARLISLEDFKRLVAAGCKPRRGDVLLAKDGAYCLDTACEFQQDEEMVLLSSIAILRPKLVCSSSFLYLWLSLDSTKQYLKEGFRSGSAIPRVVLRDLKRARITVPQPALIEAFDGIVKPIRRQERLNVEATETLSALRDALLPKLLSGEIRVKGDESAVEEVS